MNVLFTIDATTFKMHADDGSGAPAQKLERVWHAAKVLLLDAEGVVESIIHLKAGGSVVVAGADTSLTPSPFSEASKIITDSDGNDVPAPEPAAT